jgi:hypothetical protein
MLRGWLDELTSSGFVDGWAVDTAALDRPLSISILDRDGLEIGWGLAHRYRLDLAAAAIGTGWCAFRVRVSDPPRWLRGAAMTLAERTTGTTLHHLDPVPYSERQDRAITTIGDFIKARGVNAFVRAAYVYVLGRPVDEAGLARYGGMIRKATLMAVELLAILADSEEYRARPRSLAAPNTPSFPFHCG